MNISDAFVMRTNSDFEYGITFYMVCTGRIKTCVYILCYVAVKSTEFVIMRKLESFFTRNSTLHCIYIKLITVVLATNLALFLTFFNSLLFTREFVKERILTLQHEYVS